jgi:TolA-binding protein
MPTTHEAALNRTASACLAILLGLLSACGQDQPAQMLETAQFEERQNNAVHAKQLYEDIVRQYPDSQAAKAARARLEELEKKN